MQTGVIPREPVYCTGREQGYIAEAIAARRLSGDGSFTERCRAWLKRHTGCGEALLTHSCTAALEMAALLLDIQPGDEVIMPSFTFPSTANAFVLRGGIPVFADIDPDTMNISPDAVRKAVTSKTKAVVPVHYAGLPCDMDAIMELGAEHGLAIVEDAAQALCTAYKGVPLGCIGHLACLSFHESKNIQCGEGGALLINDPKYIERALVLREKGTNRTAFLQGQVDKYTWTDIGSSYLPSELNAAFLLAQLEDAEHITKDRLRVCEIYHRLLQPLQRAGKIKFLDRGAHLGANGHIFWILTNSLQERMALSAFLKERRILAFFHYVPLHSSPAGIRLGRTCGGMEHTNRASECLLRLPLHVGMPEEDIQAVADAVARFFFPALGESGDTRSIFEG
ncbi:MAG: dTDP-4-amino-4,6-dideoxygalactose transaminase [Deltaproteobacteria bacterium]|jgi:dTDP-4-amino-4,6-dideoxygalactose transaminase|nr:dTDP-4-amino-4,6-dideoxygalactose transaminase [Deltaproteobacteria bacterium]